MSEERKIQAVIELISDLLVASPFLVMLRLLGESHTAQEILFPGPCYEFPEWMPYTEDVNWIRSLFSAVLPSTSHGSSLARHRSPSARARGRAAPGGAD